jgi:hypothetical protein
MALPPKSSAARKYTSFFREENNSSSVGGPSQEPTIKAITKRGRNFKRCSFIGRDI